VSNPPLQNENSFQKTRIVLTADALDCDVRVDKFLFESLKDFSRSFIQKSIKEGNLYINTLPAKAAHRLKAGDCLVFEIQKPRPPRLSAQDIALNILFEDEHLLIVDKPKGMVVHPSPGHEDQTLVNAILSHCGDSLSGIGGVLRPGIVHRIDKDTSGAICVCKTDAAHRGVAEMLSRHDIDREYRAIVFGAMKENHGVIEADIGRSKKDFKLMCVGGRNAKHAVTHYEVIENFKDFSYLKLKLETGRTHQIRVHMCHIGHPVLGDTVYSKRKQPFASEGQVLHAHILGFKHPVTGLRISATAPLPAYFTEILSRL